MLLYMVRLLAQIEFGDAAAGAQTAVGHPGGLETILGHEGRILAGLLHIAADQFPGHLEHIGFVLFMDKRGAFFHGLFRVKDGRQRAVV